MKNKIQLNIEEWVESHYQKFPIVQSALIEYWKTIFELTKEMKPENIRSGKNFIHPILKHEIEVKKNDFKPVLDCEVGYEDPQYHNGIEGWQVKFFDGNYPENPEHRKTMESAIKNLLEKMPDVMMIQSSVDITPFLNLTPKLHLLLLQSCKSTKILSPKIGSPLLKNLNVLHFRGCDDLEHIPIEIGNLPNLRRIELEACINIQTLPESLAKIPTLKGIILGPNLPIEYPNLTIPPSLYPYIHYRSEKDSQMI